MPKNGSSLSSSEDEGLDPKKETINRRKPYPHNKRAYRHRNKIERMFCRLKDARRIATRYDKCANNFLSAVCLVAYLLLVKLSLDPSVLSRTFESLV